MLKIRSCPAGFTALVQSAMVRVKCMTKDCGWTVNLTGRPGTVKVTCPKCGASGDLTYEQVRLSPASYDVAITERNRAADKHGKYRVRTSYVYLCIIYSLADRGVIRPGAEVVAPGASIQMGGKPGHGNQLAHQVFREVTIDGTYVYELIGLTSDEKEALVYCCSVCSDIEAIYNESDCLVEQRIKDPFVALVNDVINMEMKGVRKINFSLIFRRLLVMFAEACTDAMGALRGEIIGNIDDLASEERNASFADREKKLKQLGILTNYIRGAHELSGKSEAIINLTTAGWIKEVKTRLVSAT